MTKDEALKLALEALKTIDEAMPFPVAKLAQAAIKEALAQPEQDWIERERAVGYREGHQNAIKQMAQPEQEPVAFEKTVCPFCTSEWVTAEQHDRNVDRVERKPLSDEEIERIYDRYGGNMTNCARAIERAHGIKGEA
jgi:hypothetical protein